MDAVTHLYLNGEFLPADEARLSVHDHGFLYGAGCFETFRTFGGKVFLLNRHLERLRAGCERLRIIPGQTSLINDEKLLETLRELLHLNHLNDAVFRLTVSGGPAAGGLPREPYRRPTELLVPRPLPPAANLPAGLHLLHARRNSAEFNPRPKSLAYLNSLAGHLEMRERNLPEGDEGLMSTDGGTLAEGVTTNLFLIQNNALCTPGTAAGILEGVTRGFVLETAKRMQVQAREATCRMEDLENADGLFLTNAVRGLVPVGTVFDRNGRELRGFDSETNPVFKALNSAYHEAVSKVELGD